MVVRCLVVDDDPIVLSLVRKCLQEAGHEPTCATGGREAADIWDQTRPELVVTDWVMPGMDGEQLCRHIRGCEDAAQTYIIMLTACDSQDDTNHALKMGIDDYVTKPFCREELALRVAIGVRTIELRQALAHRIEELERALARVETLEGLLPICSYCKRIRDHNGEWHDLHTYMQQHTHTQFSHGYCKECMDKHVRPQMDMLLAQAETERRNAS
jgi:DNA-binding response OmpR family regulator